MRIRKTSQYIENGLTLLDVYPVGSIYMSLNNIDPSILFGGTWEQIKDTFLLSAGDTYDAGDTGGSASTLYTPSGTVQGHTLTINEIPSHNHKLVSNTGTGNSDAISLLSVNRGQDNNASLLYSSSVGGGGSHSHNFNGTQSTINTMPPYLTVYMWQRII